MALQKQPININFSQGLDTKTDSKQVQLGKFLSLQNSVFDTAGRLTKRNGFANITALPNDQQTTLTTLNDNLLATGSNLYAFSQDTNQWLNQGLVQPVTLDVQPLVRVSTSQSSPDAAVSATGLTCLAYVDNSVAYYQVSDSTTGQQVVARTALPATATNPRVFLLGRYFIITFMATVSAATHLRYVAVPTAVPTAPHAPADISTDVKALTTGYDGYVTNNNLYMGWSASGNAIKLAYLTSGLIASSPVSIAAHTADVLSMTADTSASTAVIWISFWDTSSANMYSAAYSQLLVSVLAPTLIVNQASITELVSVAAASLQTIFFEVQGTYTFSPSNRTDRTRKATITQSGTVVAPATLLRSVGIASKPFIDPDNSTVYMLVAFGSPSQPSYFLIDSLGNIIMRLAYSNGGGYSTTQVVPTVSLLNGKYLTPYLIKDFLATVNKDTDLPSGTPTAGIYTQTGINLAKFSINTSGQHSSEIANTLFLTGGQLWQYDGVRPVENGFQVWPEQVGGSTATGSGSIAAGTYYYAFCYEWTDNQGNLQRSAPSIPFLITTTTANSTNTINVPTLRLTAKLSPNPVRIVGYRWSTAQEVYYQFTSITAPVVNDTTVDSVTFVDAQSDLAILGQTILYTTGGVIENIAAPASIASALYKNRLWLIDAEDQNLLWFSKQVIEATPVEMSDLLTLYVAPTSGAQGSTGPLTALGAMDDKLIMFKKDAIYYLTGTGPDNTGGNNDFSDPTFITSSVGCANPNSIVLMPSGIMFQSDKGIWLLGRDLSTTYIGAAVEAFNSETVLSATAIPGTNQVRFILDNKITLMYDYFYAQWGTFTNISAISATLYQAAHTYLNLAGAVFQESPGTYVDGSTPVLLSLTTSWINIAGVQGYERFYFANLLGSYFTPFKLAVSLSYDYNESPTQSTLVLPDNYTPAYGGEAGWGSGGVWGGTRSAAIFSARVFPQKQKCQAFQVTLSEVYDNSFGVPAGQGLTLSGILLTVGVKRGSRTQSAAKSFG